MVCINVWERLAIEQKGITTMQDTNWNQIEWELLSEATEIAPPWKDGHFFNTFNLDMDGIRQIRIWRDEEYMLRAEASGQYKKREGGEEPEPGVVERSTLKGWWNHSYEAKLIQCIPENTTTNYLLREERAEVACKMSVCKIKVKPAKGVPKQERVSLVEWCINAPDSTVLYVESTERKVRTKLCKKRDRSEDTYQPHREEAFSRDTVYITFEGTGCYISRVSKKYDPQWAEKLSIEYRDAFGGVPDKKTREAVRELAGFLMGRDLKLIGRSEYDRGGYIIRAMAQNPQSVNIRKVCQLCNQEIVPVHVYGDDSLNFKETMEALLPVYLHSEMREAIHATLPLYWSSFILYVDNAIPVIASAIEALQKSWFALEENQSAAVYYPKAEFRKVRKQLIDILDAQLEESLYKNAVKNKVDQLNMMSVRDRNTLFFEQLGIKYGENEVRAVRMRNVFAHGDTNGGEQVDEMIDAIKVLQMLYAKSVLKILGYEGDYIDWAENHERKIMRNVE